MESGAELVVLAELKTRNSFRSFGKRRYVFTAIKAFKGSGNDPVVVWTESFETACGLQVKRDVPYVLFVYREDNKMMVDHCSSWPLTQQHSYYTDAFNDFYKLTGSDALKVHSIEIKD